MAVGTVVMFLGELNAHGLAYAQTSAMIVLAIFQWFHAFNARHELKSIFQIGVFTNRAVIFTLGFEAVLLLFAVYNTIFQRFLKTVPVHADVWIKALAIAVLVVVVEEIRKYLFRRFNLNRYFTRH
jgi:P-type Ca2+ transporter type 2C